MAKALAIFELFDENLESGDGIWFQEVGCNMNRVFMKGICGNLEVYACLDYQCKDVALKSS